MKYSLILLLSVLIIQKSVAPPVTKDKKESENEVEETIELGDVTEYGRYLQEVVQALESDPDFREKLKKTDEKDIRNGNVAHELEFVSHHVRTKLDELKRMELERLRHLAIKQYELENGLDVDHLKIPEHVDHTNPHTFEIDDLKKLIAKTTKDLDKANERRKEEFKQYEMNKKFEQEEKMKNMSEEERKKYENELHDLEKKHKDHEPLHHPGSKKQLEEVWEKQDHMENQEFNPRTFFFLHDLDGNGVWDENEIKALFLNELNKLYNEGHAEDDLVERVEEMERMREHVIKEVDLNKDGFISYEEFLNESKKTEFEQDPGWVTLDQQNIYSEQEYEEYKRQKAKEIERAIARGMSQEYHPAVQPQAGYEQFPPHPNPNQVPHQGYVQQQHQAQYQHPQQGQYQQMPPQHGQYQQHMPPQQGQYQQAHYQQMPPQQAQYQQMPPQQQQQYHSNQVPASNNINQVPQQQQQQQFHSNQVPVSNNVNHIPQQQNYPVPNQQVPQQQNAQQPPNTNQIPQQQFNPPSGQQQQGQPQAANLNNQPHQQIEQNNPSNHEQKQEQIASINNAQAHQNTQNDVKS